jgi:HemY protein
MGYAYARPGDSPRDRLDRIKSLIVLDADETEARIARASAAVDARDWDEAREALEPLLERSPTSRVCALMARVEGGQYRDAGRVREWLARAVRAPRDPVWMADGVIFSAWQPVSPITGLRDAFVWRVPPDRSERGEGKDPLDEFAALSRDMESAALPPVGEPVADTSDGPMTITVAPRQADPQTAASTSDSKAVAVITEPSAGQVTPDDAAQVVVVESDGDMGGGMSVRDEAAIKGDDAGMPAPGGLPSKRKERQEPNIFVPGRAPDDPGPEPTDYDDGGSTPFKRYRDGLKTQTS